MSYSSGLKILCKKFDGIYKFFDFIVQIKFYQFDFCRKIFRQKRLSSSDDAAVDDGRKLLQLFNSFLKSKQKQNYFLN